MPRRLPSQEDPSQPQLVKVEANLLRLPLFSLYAQELKTLDGIACRGQVTYQGQTYQYAFEATRNVKLPYPGPLARAAHLAFLSLLTDRGLPLANPVTWSWRELCRRMGVTASGQMVARLKGAIRSTAGLLIHSENALYAKPAGQPIVTREADLHLYDEVVFAAERLPDGRVADTNHLWMSQWYLDNVNSLFTAPLDYALWRHLDRLSPVASRLYEFLFLKFYRGVPVLRLNYQNLVRMLPLRPERYASKAKEQLGPAIQHLVDVRLLDAATAWGKNKEGVLQLHFHRGERLALPRGQATAALPDEGLEEALEVQELRNLKPAEWELVASFYRLWRAERFPRPTAKELGQARELLQAHGVAKAKALIPLVVRRLQRGWPDAKTFGAAIRYLGDASEDYEQEQRRLAAERAAKAQEAVDREAQVRSRQHDERLASLWDNLPGEEQAAIEGRVLAEYPLLKRGTHFLRMMCLAELGRRLEAGGEPG